MDSEPRPKGIAFFDFDKTLLTVDSGPIYGFRIYRDGLARAYPSIRAGLAGIGYKLGLVKRRSIARLGVAAYVGLERKQIDEWMAQAYPKLIAPHLSGPVVAALRAHQAAGLKTAIVTASPPFFVRAAAKALGVDEVFGSNLDYDSDGVCTGIYADKYLGGKVKRDTGKAYAESLGFKLSDCWFYSDHIADLSFLEAVGHPVAVSPESKLRRIAEARGWTILEHHADSAT